VDIRGVNYAGERETASFEAVIVGRRMHRLSSFIARRAWVVVLFGKPTLKHVSLAMPPCRLPAKTDESAVALPKAAKNARI
jgi:hypothetical protein